MSRRTRPSRQPLGRRGRPHPIPTARPDPFRIYRSGYARDLHDRQSARRRPRDQTGTGTTDPFTLTGLTNRTTHTVTVAATNALGTGPASTSSYAFTPLGTLRITTAYQLPGASVGKPYHTTLTASGGTGGNVWSLPRGSSLPAGPVLQANGTISGTPMVA